MHKQLNRRNFAAIFCTLMAHSQEYLYGDIIVQEVDARHLEDGLKRTAELIDNEQPVVVLLTRYNDLLHTQHVLDYALLSELMGVRVGLVEDKEKILSMPLLFRPVKIDSYEGFVHGTLSETLRHAPNDTGHPFVERLDKVLTNRWFGFPVLIVVLYLVFSFTFSLGAYPQGWIETGIDLLCGWLTGVLPQGWLSSLLVDGVVQGVGAVLSFLPNIVILFFCLSIMEDTGYMARAAFLMDKVMHAVGLHGRSFIPMLMGFGCNVPAIMAARSIENKKDRTLTMLMIPFMSCSARIPVYMLIVSAFFPGNKALMMISMYLIGVVLSIVFAMVMKHTPWFKQEKRDYVSELPQYRKLVWRETWQHIWDRVWDYLQKIGTVILWASIIIWVLTYFPSHSMDLEHSYLAMLGQRLSPLMRPLGFDWQMTVCLLTGLPAKEAIVSTMGILYHAQDGLSTFTPVTGFTFMLFVLLYFPCIATIATLRREAGRGWAWFTVVHSLCLAWLVCFVVYQASMLCN